MGVGALKSTQEANRTAVPPVMNGPSFDGKLRIARFAGVVAGADVAVGTTLDLVWLPAGAVFMFGYWYNDATFAGLGVTIDIGIAADPNGFAAALDVSAECWTYFPNTAAVAGGAYSYGYALTAAQKVYATTAVDVIVATGVYKGFIAYMVD